MAVLCFQHVLTPLSVLTARGGHSTFLMFWCLLTCMSLLDFDFSLLSFFFKVIVWLVDYTVSVWSNKVHADVAAPGQVALLQEERNSLLAENDVLTDRANQLDTFEDPSTPSGKKHSQLQQQLELLQEENFRFVTGRSSVSWPPTAFECQNDFVNWRALGWRLPRMTIGSTVRIWRSSW